MRNRTLAGLLWAALACLILLPACADRQGGPGPGQRFPALPLAALTGPAPIAQPGSDKTLVINFWATWCGPCRSEMAGLQRLAEALDPARFAVIGISVDDDVNLAREAILREGWHFARFHVAREEARQALGLHTLPRSYVVAPDGRILRTINGAQDWGSAAAIASVGRLSSRP